MSPLLLSLATFASTLAGGLFALRFRSRMHFILAFTAGVLLWLVYGLALGDWPLSVSSALTAALMLVIVGLKLRYG